MENNTKEYIDLDHEPTKEKFNQFFSLNLMEFSSYTIANVDSIVKLTRELKSNFHVEVLASNFKKCDQMTIVNYVASYKDLYIVIACLYIAPDLINASVSEVLTAFKEVKEEIKYFGGGKKKKAFFISFVVEILNNYDIKNKYPLYYEFIKNGSSKYNRFWHSIIALDPYYGVGYCKQCQTIHHSTQNIFSPSGELELGNCSFCGIDLSEDNLVTLANKNYKNENYEQWLEVQEKTFKV